MSKQQTKGRTDLLPDGLPDWVWNTDPFYAALSAASRGDLTLMGQEWDPTTGEHVFQESYRSWYQQFHRWRARPLGMPPGFEDMKNISMEVLDQFIESRYGGFAGQLSQQTNDPLLAVMEYIKGEKLGLPNYQATQGLQRTYNFVLDLEDTLDYQAVTPYEVPVENLPPGTEGDPFWEGIREQGFAPPWDISELGLTNIDERATSHPGDRRFDEAQTFSIKTPNTGLTGLTDVHLGAEPLEAPNRATRLGTGWTRENPTEWDKIFTPGYGLTPDPLGIGSSSWTQHFINQWGADPDDWGDTGFGTINEQKFLADYGEEPPAGRAIQGFEELTRENCSEQLNLYRAEGVDIERQLDIRLGHADGLAGFERELQAVQSFGGAGSVGAEQGVIAQRDKFIQDRNRIISDPCTFLKTINPAFDTDARTGGGGGGGGFGSGRVYAEPDRNEIRDYIRLLAQALIGSNATDEEVERWVNQYLKTSRYNFDNPSKPRNPQQEVKDTLRGTSSYKRLHQYRPDHVPEEQWLQLYQTGLRQGGLYEGAVGEVAEQLADDGRDFVYVQEHAQLQQAARGGRAPMLEDRMREGTNVVESLF